jgi:GT2 family glycosyltransferase
MINITCIIPTKGHESAIPFLKNCLFSLERASIKEISLKVLVISSNSQVEKYCSNFVSNFFLVDPSLNFSEMNNFAISKSIKLYKSDYYLFINDDAKINRDFFQNFLLLNRRKKLDVFIPLILCLDKKTIDSIGQEYFRSGYVKNATDLNIETILGAGACFIVKTQILKKMRNTFSFYFNPILNYYLEDTEFSLRLLALGAYTKKTPLLKVFHYGSLTTGYQSDFVLYQTFRNMLWVIILTWPFAELLKNLPLICTTHLWLVITTFKLKLPFIYKRIFTDTFFSRKKLLKYRERTISAYPPSFVFSSVFSTPIFRTRKKNIPIYFPFETHREIKTY